VTPQLNLVQSRATGIPVVFQHGLCGSAAQTAEAFPHDPTYRMLTLECRGHGASQAGDTKAFSIKTFAHDVAAMVEAQDIAPCVVGGISMGAAISLHLAIHRPDLVKALVLARPAWLIEDGPANMQPNAEVGSLLSRFSSAEAKAKFIAGDTSKALAQNAPDNLASLMGFFDREPMDVTSALLTRISADGPGVTDAQIRAIKVPTLIIATAQDHVHPIAHAEALHSMIPHSRLAIITAKGVDKHSYVTEFRQTLLTFFKENN
jgi:pimeloyl-ACP methyl ester carboxylesterase